MSFTTAAPAQRLARPRWRDPRLLAGLLLVLGSMVAGAQVLGRADDTRAVWALTHDLGPDTELRSTDLEVRRVGLEGSFDRYVAATGEPPVGRVLQRPVGRGELLPGAALVDSPRAGLQMLPVRVESATGLARGSVVDVYSVPSERTGRAAAPPALLLPAVTVADVPESGRSLSATAATDVLLVVGREQVQPLLAAQAGGEVRLARAVSSLEAATAATGTTP